MRYPIIEGQGNFGSIDGDSQAAVVGNYTAASDTSSRVASGVVDGNIWWGG
jgi:DNA gyrase/topoisomerase IV subunit A